MACCEPVGGGFNEATEEQRGPCLDAHFPHCQDWASQLALTISGLEAVIHMTPTVPQLSGADPEPEAAGQVHR